MEMKMEMLMEMEVGTGTLGRVENGEANEVLRPGVDGTKRERSAPYE